jgi:predicted DNA-binding antitoxin AbrB/MazE fold protein
VAEETIYYTERSPIFHQGAKAMSLTVEAIYANGVLKPKEPLSLREGEKVRITIASVGSVAEATAGLLKWTGDPETLRCIAEDPEYGILGSP